MYDIEEINNEIKIPELAYFYMRNNNFFTVHTISTLALIT